MKPVAIVTMLAMAVAGLAWGDSVTISDIDNSRLLIDQTVGVYVSVTDGSGHPVGGLDAEDFEIFESVPGGAKEEPREIIDFRQGINMSQGITMFLLIDNSGSMYDRADGTQTEVEGEWRITFAKDAVKSLLQDIKNPADKVGIAAFNVKVGNTLKPTKDIVEAEELLSDISRPGKGEGYTELYESLYQSVETVRNTGGRKVIVLLSDGEDYPLEDNPNMPERRGLDGAVEFARDEGVSVFCIGLSRGADAATLQRISRETGGAFYSIYDPGKLGELYGLIRTQVLNEYWMAFKGGMLPSVRKNVRVVYAGGADNQREYYSDTMFGLPQEPFNPLFFLAIPLALLLLWLLSRMKFEKKQELPSLQVLSSAGKRGGPAITIAEGKDAVTIGGNATADLTIVGDPAVTMMEATVTRKGDAFTIAGDDIKVNNRKVKTKVLAAGDVITVGDTTVVFDEGVARTLAAASSPPSKKRTPASIKSAKQRTQKSSSSPAGRSAGSGGSKSPGAGRSSGSSKSGSKGGSKSRSSGSSGTASKGKPSSRGSGASGKK